MILPPDSGTGQVTTVSWPRAERRCLMGEGCITIPEH